MKRADISWIEDTFKNIFLCFYKVITALIPTVALSSCKRSSWLLLSVSKCSIFFCASPCDDIFISSSCRSFVVAWFLDVKQIQHDTELFLFEVLLQLYVYSLFHYMSSLIMKEARDPLLFSHFYIINNLNVFFLVLFWNRKKSWTSFS